MTDNEFKGYRCWDAGTVQRTIFGDIASLGLDADAVFLAAHSSVTIDHAKGVHRLGVEGERAVLDALTSGFGIPDSNTLVAVTGASGSGKSHLVRWVRAHLREDAEAYHLVYVPRELATLRDLLGHVLDRMPGTESDAVRAELEKAIGAKPPEQLAEDLLDGLRSVLRYELPENREGTDYETRQFLLGSFSDEGGVRRSGGVADLLLEVSIREHFLRKDGAISKMIDSVRGERRGGDETTPEFTSEDWPSQKSKIVTGLNSNLRALFTMAGRDPMAVEILNEARNRAIAETLGMRQGVNLAEVFSTTRRRLKTEGKDLVLLFEDLAQFGLFDGELFNQLGLQPGDDLAPIRAVFAITDGKFNETVPDTVVTRLTHRFKVHDLVTAGVPGYEQDSRAFLARYLNVARVGRDRLIQAWSDADDGSRETGDWIPNACLDRGDGRECSHRETCWDAFGKEGDFGLYPYNEQSIERALRKKGDRITARTVVDEMVHGFLVEADPTIEAGLFPPESAKERFDFGVGVDKASVLRGFDGSPADQDRLHRCRVIWADGGIEEAGVRLAFNLPSSDAGPPIETATAAPRATTPAPPRGVPVEPLRALFAWENGEGLTETEVKWYRDRLHELALSRLNLGSLLVDSAKGIGDLLLKKLLAATSFRFEKVVFGQSVGDDRLEFSIANDQTGVLLLAGVRWLWDHKNWDVTSETRSWDFPLDPLEAQICLDEFLDMVADQVEGAVVASLMAGPLDPSTAAMAVRTVARLLLGERPPDNCRVLPWCLSLPTEPRDQPSEQWAPVWSEAGSALRDVSTAWVTAFATARQGDGAPIVVDATRLNEVAELAVIDPLAALGRCSGLNAAASEIMVHAEELSAKIEACLEVEAEAMRKTAADLRHFVGGSEFASVVVAAQIGGDQASAATVFRPVADYTSFRDATGRLIEVPSSEVATWLAASDQIFLDGEVDLGEVLLAQGWFSAARQVQADLVVVQRCLSDTSDEVKARLELELGVVPEDVAIEIGSRLTAAMKLVQSTLGGGK
jgi:hypothetical protein